MPIDYQKKKAVLSGQVTIDETDQLLEWLQRNRKAVIDLAACEHLHSAILQVLMSARPRCVVPGEHDGLKRWLATILPATPSK
jgi:anti-anti-sigma regulatory factor